MGVTCVVSPSSCAASLASSTFHGLFGALTQWIVASVQWLLSTAGRVLTAPGEPATIVASSRQEFGALTALAPGIMAIGLGVTTVQALRRGDTAALWRAYFAVAPACVAAIVFARPLAATALAAVDAMSSGAASTVRSHEAALAHALAGLAPTTPGFGLFVMAVTVVLGTWLLWCELVVRAVVLTLLVVLVPVVVPLSTFPSLRRIGARLAETFLAVAFAKFLIVVTLALGLSELTGSTTTEVLTGAATLLLATATPYVALRAIPFVEQSALHGFEGVRTRATRAVTRAPSSAARAARALTPDAPVPTPPPRGEDLGLDMWPGEGETPMPPLDGERPAPPIGTPRRRGGHVVYGRDDVGPVVGWHFDE